MLLTGAPPPQKKNPIFVRGFLFQSLPSAESLENSTRQRQLCQRKICLVVFAECGTRQKLYLGRVPESLGKAPESGSAQRTNKLVIQRFPVYFSCTPSAFVMEFLNYSSYTKSLVFFSQSHKYVVMVEELVLINLQPHYYNISCYLNCCSRLYYLIMLIKNQMQGKLHI